MSLSQGGLAALYLWSFLLGIFLGGVYDLLRVTRVLLGVHYSQRTAERLQTIQLPLLGHIGKRKRSSRLLGVVLFLEDLFFCLTAGVAMILLFYGANHGKIRIPALLLAAVGFLAYRLSIGRAVMAFSELIAYLIEALLRYVLLFVGYPISILYRLGRRGAEKVAMRLRQHAQLRARRRYTAAETARVSKNACGLISEEIDTRGVKGGKQIVRQKQKTIQPITARSRASRRAGGHLHRHLR